MPGFLSRSKSSKKKDASPPKSAGSTASQQTNSTQPSSFRVITKKPPSPVSSSSGASRPPPARSAAVNNSHVGNNYNNNAAGLNVPSPGSALSRASSRGSRYGGARPVPDSPPRRTTTISGDERGGGGGGSVTTTQQVSLQNKNGSQPHQPQGGAQRHGGGSPDRQINNNILRQQPPRSPSNSSRQGAPPPPRVPSHRSLHLLAPDSSDTGLRPISSGRPPSSASATRRLAPNSIGGPYPPLSSHKMSHRPLSIASVDLYDSLNDHAAVDRYPRPFVTPQNEFNTPLINGINPNRDRNYTRSQSMTSEFAAQYSLEGVEGMPGAPPPPRFPRAPSSQGVRRGNMPPPSPSQPGHGRQRSMSLHGNAGADWDIGVGGSTMAGMDGPYGATGGARQPRPPPVPRIPSAFKPGPSSQRQVSLAGPNNYSQYPPQPPPQGPHRPPRNHQQFPPQFPDLDMIPGAGRSRGNSRPPPSQGHLAPNGHPMRRNSPSPSPEHRRQMRSERNSYDMKGGNQLNGQHRSNVDSDYKQHHGTVPAALPTPSITPTPPSRTSSQEKIHGSDVEIVNEQRRESRGHQQRNSNSSSIRVVLPSNLLNEHGQSVIQQSNSGRSFNDPPSPISTPGTPITASSASSARYAAFNQSISQQINLSAPIMPGPAKQSCLGREISVVMEECIVGHGLNDGRSMMKKTGNWQHTVGCMLCGGNGDDHCDGMEEGAVTAGKRWLWLCSWCALRVCGDCRCRLTDEEEIAKRKRANSSDPIRIDLKALRDSIMNEKELAVQQQKSNPLAPTTTTTTTTTKAQEVAPMVSHERSFSSDQSQTNQRLDYVSQQHPRDSGVAVRAGSEESISSFDTANSNNEDTVLYGTPATEESVPVLRTPPPRKSSMPQSTAQTSDNFSTPEPKVERNILPQLTPLNTVNTSLSQSQPSHVSSSPISVTRKPVPGTDYPQSSYQVPPPRVDSLRTVSSAGAASNSTTTAATVIHPNGSAQHLPSSPSWEQGSNISSINITNKILPTLPNAPSSPLQSKLSKRKPVATPQPQVQPQLNTKLSILSNTNNGFFLPPLSFESSPTNHNDMNMGMFDAQHNLDLRLGTAELQRETTLREERLTAKQSGKVHGKGGKGWLKGLFGK